MFSTSFTKGNDLCDFLFASLEEQALPKCVLLLTLLHSEWPILYGSRIKGKNLIFLLRVGPF